MTGFFRDFLSAGLKGNKNLHFAVITSAMRVVKSGIYTGLDNLGVYSVLSDEYSQYFGFTKDEVKKFWTISDTRKKSMRYVAGMTGTGLG